MTLERNNEKFHSVVVVVVRSLLVPYLDWLGRVVRGQ